ncbi:MAG: iron-sulfur cluster carrier protein ApbC [Gammaproteobacteria bacterium]|nr:iron-sulfur cluster carrier protein ApbC [Gammaproteobacteria bacterium]
MARPLETFPDPVLGTPWGELGAVRRAARLDDRWHAEVCLGYPVDGLEDAYTRAAAGWLEDDVVLDLTFRAPTQKGIPGAKNVIAVASGKGGVGKSTVAVNLALALDRIGAKAGVLDADIYGPSQGIMLGVPEGRRPEVRDEKFFVPIKAHGIEAMSMSMLVTDRTPMVWRGPMVSGALQQLLNQSAWSDLDYLVVDMPPGTGDIQLTLSQAVPVGGAVIVTTPQDIALADARKGIEMFSKVNIPILGVVENMSYFACGDCGARHDLFGSGGGARVAEEYGTELLGEFPLAPEIREQTDAGRPTVASDPEGEIAGLYRDCARRSAAALWRTLAQAAPAPAIRME